MLFRLFPATATIGTFAAAYMPLTVMAMLLTGTLCGFFLVDKNSVAIDCQIKTAAPLEYDLLRTVGGIAAGIPEGHYNARMRFFDMSHVHKNPFAALVVSAAQVKQGCGLWCLKVLQGDMQVIIADTVAKVLFRCVGSSGSCHMTSQVISDEKSVTRKHVPVNENEI